MIVASQRIVMRIQLAAIDAQIRQKSSRGFYKEQLFIKIVERC